MRKKILSNTDAKSVYLLRISVQTVLSSASGTDFYFNRAVFYVIYIDNKFSLMNVYSHVSMI